MKRKLLAAVVATLTATATLLTPSLAFGATITPDGSVAYGENAYCSFPAGYNPGEFGADPADATCSAIPTGTWTTAELPAPNTTTKVITPSFGQFSWVGNVQPDGGAVWTEDTNAHDYDRGFYIKPAAPESLPFLASTTFTTSGYNSEVISIQNVTAYAVVDKYEGFPIQPGSGTVIQAVEAGSVTPVELTNTGADSYSADFILPAPTWQERTDGVLNTYGWTGHILTIVEATRDGEPFTDVSALYFSFQTPVFADIRNLSEDVVLGEDEIGVGGSTYSINGQTGFTPSLVVPEPEPEPEPQPEPVDPPVVVPPVVTPPVVTPEPQPQPEPQPERPIINTGGTSEELPLAVFGVPLALAMFGAGAIWFFTRRDDEEVTQ